MSLSTTTESDTQDAGRPRQRARATADVRERLLAAALVEFAEHGFVGASTRAIAERAGAHQPQINYHFDSKESLWRAVLDRLMDELDELMPTIEGLPPRDTVAGSIRALVRFTARRPELNRIMVHEATSDNERIRWLVETHLRDRAAGLLEIWAEAAAEGVTAPVPAELVYHTLIGATALLHTVAPEARLLFGIEPAADDTVDAQADALVQLFLPPTSSTPTDPTTETTS